MCVWVQRAPEGMGLPRWAFHPGGSNFSGAAAPLSPCIPQILTPLGHCCSYSDWMFLSPILTSLLHSDFGSGITVLARKCKPKTWKEKVQSKHHDVFTHCRTSGCLSCSPLLQQLLDCDLHPHTLVHLGLSWKNLRKNTLQGGRVSGQTANPAGFQMCSMWRTIRLNITNWSLFVITLRVLFNTCCSSLGQADTHENLAVGNI